MELRRFPFRADIFFQRRDLFDRKIELVISRILDRDIVPVYAGKLDGTDPEILTDTMRGLYDIIAGNKIRKIADLLPPGAGTHAAHLLLPQYISRCNDSQCIISEFKAFRQKAMDQRNLPRLQRMALRNMEIRKSAESSLSSEGRERERGLSILLRADS